MFENIRTRTEVQPCLLAADSLAAHVPLLTGLTR
jgi:hypothetical protein